MTHKRKDTFISVWEWHKHLRPFYKKLYSRLERMGAKKRIKKDMN